MQNNDLFAYNHSQIFDLPPTNIKYVKQFSCIMIQHGRCMEEYVA